MRRLTISAVLALFVLSLAAPALAQKPPMPPEGAKERGPGFPGGPEGPGGPEFDGDRPPKPPMGEDHDMIRRKMEEWKKGRDPREIEEYEKKIAKIRNESEILLQTAKIYLEDKKDPAKAVEAVKKVLAIEIPDGPLADEMRKKQGHVYMMAIDACLKAGMTDEALKFVSEAEGAFKDRPEVAVQLYKKLADIHRKAGRPDEALKALEKAAELNAQIK